MKNIIFIISIILLSCNNNNSKTTINKNKNIKYQPIFLNLSPKMSDSVFNSELRKNIEINEDEEFLLPINTNSNNDKNDDFSENNNNIKFKVSKENKRIKLSYEYTTDIRIEFLDDYTSNYWFDKNTNLIKNFIYIFEQKYKYINQDNFPFKPNKENVYEPSLGMEVFGVKQKKLNDYGFEKQNYRIFQDSVKTILIGYESQIPYPKKEKYSLEHPMNTAAISLEINYMHNSDFNDLKKKIFNEKKIFDKALKKHDSIRFSKELLGRENLRKI